MCKASSGDSLGTALPSTSLRASSSSLCDTSNCGIPTSASILLCAASGSPRRISFATTGDTNKSNLCAAVAHHSRVTTCRPNCTTSRAGKAVASLTTVVSTYTFFFSGFSSSAIFFTFPCWTHHHYTILRTANQGQMTWMSAAAGRSASRRAMSGSHPSPESTTSPSAPTME